MDDMRTMLDSMRSSSDGAELLAVDPKPGLCIKWKEAGRDDGTTKLFVNLCTCVEARLPLPDMNVDEAALTSIMESPTSAPFVIPFSLSPVRSMSTERGGQACIVVDCIIRDEFFTLRVKASELYRAYMVLVIVEGLKARHSIEVDPMQYVVLLNKRVYGQLVTQHIGKQPAVTVVNDTPVASTSGVTADRRTTRSTNDPNTVALAKKIAALPTPRVQLTQRLLKFEACISFVHALPCDYTLLEENINVWVNDGRLMVFVEDVAGVDVQLPIAVDRRTVAVRFDQLMCTVTVTADIVNGAIAT